MSGTSHRRIRLAAALSAASALALTGCSSSSSDSTAGAQTGFITASGVVATAAVGHRDDAPDISGSTVDGGKAALSDYRGKVVVLNIWGSWCPPCRAEANGLEQVYEQYKDQGVQFLGVDTRDTDVSPAQAFEKTHGITYPSLYDPDGTQILKFPKGSLNPQAIPTTIVIDRQGKLAARAMRALEGNELEDLLKPVLAEQQ